MTRRTLRPRPFDNKKKLTVVHEATGLELADGTVARSIANRNVELEKNNDRVVTVASKSGEEVVPVPGFRPVTNYEQLYPNDFKQTDDMNAEYLTSGKHLLPMESQYVEYAADSEDEDWLAANMNIDGQDRLSPWNFEKLVWKLELANSMVTQHVLRKAGASMMERKSKGTSAFVLNLSKAAAVKLMKKHEGFDTTVIERVYEYWTRKRRARKEPLLRTLQPKTAANDRDPDHTFREREKVKRPNTRRRRHVNRGESIEEKLDEIKDEMSHVCNIFKSMINREATKAHVVNVYIAQKRMLHDKLSSVDGGHPSKLKEIRKDLIKKERYLKRDDAEYRAKICRFLLQNVFHGNLRKLFASARGTEGEGGCDAAVARRLRKAQKRRQKVISFLVQDRNWQKWHDKTWMQKMFIILKKRSVLGSMTHYINQKQTWRKWEKFVKSTRDRRLRRMTDLAQKKRNSVGKPMKQVKNVKLGNKPTSETKSEPCKIPETPRKKIPLRPASASNLEGRGSIEDTAPGDAVSVEAVADSTISWAQHQGILPPQALRNTSRAIIIPSAFVVPQNGFPCLPPRLKEMYTEAEKDAMQPPEVVARKMQALKQRRQRIQQLMNEGHMDRGSAVAQFNREWRKNREAHKEKAELRKLKCSLLHSTARSRETNRSSAHTVTPEPSKKRLPAGKEVTYPKQLDNSRCSDSDCIPELTDASLGNPTISNYGEHRRKILRIIKQRLGQLEASRGVVHGSHDASCEVQRLLRSFKKLKSAKLPDIALMQSTIADNLSLLRPSVDSGNITDSFATMDLSDDVTQQTGQRKRKISKDKTSPKLKVAKHNQEADSYKETQSPGSRRKRVCLVKRRNRRMALEVRSAGRRKVIHLTPGAKLSLAPLTDGSQIDLTKLKDCMDSGTYEKTQKETPDLQMEGEKKECVPQGNQSEAMEIDDNVSMNWHSGVSREGPVAHVPVPSRRMNKTHSTPIVVTDECHRTPVKSKATHRKVAVGLGSSRRLLKGKGVSLATLRKRRRLRKKILKPFFPRIKPVVCLPRTRLRKIQALSNVKLQVPSRPERKPMFSHVFKLNRSAQADKTPPSMKLPPSVPAEVVHSGITRIGRGGRVWIDRVDPSTMRRLEPDCRTTTSSHCNLLPMLGRVLEADKRKKKIIKRQCENQSLFKKKQEERKAEQLNQMQDMAAQLSNRQQGFLPHCLLQANAQADERKVEQLSRRKKGELDPKKEAHCLHGAMIEMGLPLPLDQLCQATEAAIDASKVAEKAELQLTEKLDTDDPSARVPIKREQLERVGHCQEENRTQRGAKVTSHAEASLEDPFISFEATHQVMSPLGRVQLEEVRVGATRPTSTPKIKVLLPLLQLGLLRRRGVVQKSKSGPDSFVDVNYLSSIAPRKPRTTMEPQRTGIQSIPSRSSVDDGNDDNKHSAQTL